MRFQTKREKTSSVSDTAVETASVFSERGLGAGGAVRGSVRCELVETDSAITFL